MESVVNIQRKYAKEYMVISRNKNTLGRREEEEGRKELEKKKEKEREKEGEF